MRLRDTNRGGGRGRRAAGGVCGAPPATSTHPQGGTKGTWVPVPAVGAVLPSPGCDSPTSPNHCTARSTRGGSGEPPPVLPSSGQTVPPLIGQDLGAATREFARLSLRPRRSQGPAWVLGWGLRSLPCPPPPPKKVNLGRAERARPVRDTCCRGRAAPPAAPCSGPRTPPGLC